MLRGPRGRSPGTCPPRPERAAEGARAQRPGRPGPLGLGGRRRRAAAGTEARPPAPPPRVAGAGVRADAASLPWAACGEGAAAAALPRLEQTLVSLSLSVGGSGSWPTLPSACPRGGGGRGAGRAT